MISLVINRQSVIYSPSLLTLLETTDSPPFQLKITAQNPPVPFHNTFHDPSPTSPIPRRSRTVYVALIFFILNGKSRMWKTDIEVTL